MSIKRTLTTLTVVYSELSINVLFLIPVISNSDFQFYLTVPLSHFLSFPFLPCLISTFSPPLSILITVSHSQLSLLSSPISMPHKQHSAELHRFCGSFANSRSTGGCLGSGESIMASRHSENQCISPISEIHLLRPGGCI